MHIRPDTVCPLARRLSSTVPVSTIQAVEVAVLTLESYRRDMLGWSRQLRTQQQTECQGGVCEELPRATRRVGTIAWEVESRLRASITDRCDGYHRARRRRQRNCVVRRTLALPEASTPIRQARPAAPKSCAGRASTTNAASGHHDCVH